MIALVQNDAKRIVAYSSLSHLGLIVIAIASGNHLAIAGALVYIVAHGLFSAALFLMLGYLEEREETRSLLRLGGLGWKNPRLAGALCIAALAALGLPGLAGFVGELVILIGVYQAGYVWPVIVALVAIVLASAYMIRLYQDVMNGPEVEDVPVRADLTWLEGLAVAPLLAALVILGVYPVAASTAMTPRVYATPIGPPFFPSASSRSRRSSCCSPILFSGTPGAALPLHRHRVARNDCGRDSRGAPVRSRLRRLFRRLHGGRLHDRLPRDHLDLRRPDR